MHGLGSLQRRFKSVSVSHIYNIGSDDLLGIYWPRRLFTGEPCPWTHFIVAEILVLVGGAILPAAAVPASTRMSARLKRIQEQSSRGP